MSIDAFVFTRTEPALGMQEHEVLNLEYVQLLRPRRARAEDWQRIRSTPDPSLGWVTDVNCASSAWVQLEMFAIGLARRCGGGLWWCDLSNTIAIIPARPDPGSWTLRRALAAAQQLEADVDEADLMGSTIRGQVTDRAWEIGVARTGHAEAWLGARQPVYVFALLEGHGPNLGKAALGTTRRALEATRGHQAQHPIEPGYAAEAPSSWIRRAHAHAQATTFKKPFLRKAPEGWASLAIARAEGDQLRLAHVGDSRAYRITARGTVEQLTTEQLAGPIQGAHSAPASAIGGGEIRPEERLVQLAHDDLIVLLSFEVWRAFGAGTPEVLLAATRDRSPEAGAQAILGGTQGVTCGAVIVAHYGGSTPVQRAPARTAAGLELPVFVVVRHSVDSAIIGRRIPLEAPRSPMLIGSDPRGALEVRSPHVAPQHLRIELRSDGWYVVDHAGAGIYVDDERVPESLVYHGINVRIGDTLLELAEYIIETRYDSGSLDGLTQVANKRHLLEHLTTAPRPLAVIRIDIDRFKRINDTQGHPVGDQVLVNMGARLRQAQRPGELVARLGADDFVVVLAGAKLDAAIARATELRALLSSIAPVSVGVAEASPSHRDAAELIHDAERDLYARCRTPGHSPR